MIQLEIDGFFVDVPIKPHMDVHEFLALVSKLEVLAGRTTVPQHEAPAHAFTPLHHDMPAHNPLPLRQELAAIFKTGHIEDNVDPNRLAEHVQQHMEHLRRHESRLAAQEEHMKKVLEYLQSLDHYIRK